MKTIIDVTGSSKKLLRTYKGNHYLSDDLDGALLKIGASIVKRNSHIDKNDIVSDGTRGKIIGSISRLLSPKNLEPDYMYAVVWQDTNIPIMIRGIQVAQDMNQE